VISVDGGAAEDAVDNTLPTTPARYPRHSSDNGPDYAAVRFRHHLADLGIVHHRIPPRSPDHNAACERFHGTALQECWRPAFTGAGSPASANSKPKPTPGSPLITTAAATTTSCAAVHPAKSSTATVAAKQHDPEPSGQLSPRTPAGKH
jgi:transposase InsO family protein